MEKNVWLNHFGNAEADGKSLGQESVWRPSRFSDVCLLLKPVLHYSMARAFEDRVFFCFVLALIIGGCLYIVNVFWR